jgi:hypothetical protein
VSSHPGGRLGTGAGRRAVLSLALSRYTDHVEYLAEVVQTTIEREVRKEANYLRNLRMTREDGLFLTRARSVMSPFSVAE